MVVGCGKDIEPRLLQCIEVFVGGAELRVASVGCSTKCDLQIADGYIDPETEAFLEGEDYEGLEDEADDEPAAPAGSSPLNFFN